MERGLTVKGITKRLDLLRSAVSHHLKVLKQAGIVCVRSCDAEHYDYLTFKTAIEDLKTLFPG
ncbi:MAG: helix-turn-helix domain-containing protein [Acidaminococcus sp.]|uniref:ArsR/SmtB family transcription factor n=1 Tax=Acidaminococcus sp. TaxID=1872103 RepID=UPI002A747FF1|nr:helix-turn-helix domain-containing protein [Acidaminococcus sp.]MDY2739626.1 helix-turn-helix domain-containing protein [Acidaminococcus sp.]